MALIEIKGLYKYYGDGDNRVEVLKDIDLEILEGETAAVVGASGVGKSTLLNIIGALDRPTSGRVLFRGESIFDLDDNARSSFRNKKIGFVFQFHHLLPEFTALENVMIPALIGGGGFDEVRSIAEGLLTDVGLGRRLEHKPGQMSGGEQQRTAIVRALVQMPELILADEPTGNLDSATGKEVFDLLLDLNRDKKITIIVVTHNETLAARLDRRLEMVDGNLRQV